MIADILFNIIIFPIELLIETSYTFFSTVVRYNPVFPIFGISILVTLCCLPLYAKAESIQSKERSIQKSLKNKIARIKRCYFGNERYLILSMYYRENHYHPIMALRSSLSLLIQIPFFIAAYNFLSNLESLKGTSFYFITDLGSPDRLLTFNSTTINILPVIMTVINLISGYIYAKEHELHEKMQLLAMAALFLVLLYNSPAALVLYWTFNNIFSLLKNIVYKFKNPVRIFYFIVVFFLACSCIFVIFFRSQGKSGSLLFKSLSIGTALIISAIPLYVKILNNLGKKYFYRLKILTNDITRIFVLSAISLWILCAFIIPFNVVSSDTPAFSFLGKSPNPFSIVFPASFVCFGLFVFWPGYVFLIFSQKIKIYFSFFSSLILLFAIVNTFIFFGDNGTLSQMLTFTSGSIFNYPRSIIIINLLTFAFIFIALLFIFKQCRMFLLSSMLFIFLLGGVFITTWKGIVIQKEYRIYTAIKMENEAKNIDQANSSNQLEELQPIIGLSKTGKNVVVIMLDRAIGSYLPLIFEEKPELNSKYSGFVYYPNTISFFRSTILGAPPIFGGYEYTPEGFHERQELSMADKHDETLLLMPLLFTEQGYDVSIFDLPYVNYKEPMNTSFFTQKGIHADIFKKRFYDKYIHEFPDKAPSNAVDYDALLRRNFVFFSIVTVVPPFLRTVIYKKGSYWASNLAVSDNVISFETISDYAALYYLPQLCSYNNKKSSLTLMVNDLTHSPSFFQYPDYTVVSRISDIGPERFNGNLDSQKHYHANAAAYLVLARWLDVLRENEVYDNTRIIIVSDHDELLVKPLFSTELNRINTFYNPVLLVKDFGTAGNLKTNMDFMTTADVPLIACAGIIENPKNPFTGKILKAEKDDGVNIYLGGSAYTRDYQSWEALEKTSSFYHVADNIFDEKNWTKISKQY